MASSGVVGAVVASVVRVREVAGPKCRCATLTADKVEVTFSTVPILMPAIFDELVRDHLDERGLSQCGRQNWLFPGGQPGHHLQTENTRRQLVETGIKPPESRKAPLFQLAADMPAPIAELLGSTEKNAANWARIPARDWTGYIADRAR